MTNERNYLEEITTLLNEAKNVDSENIELYNSLTRTIRLEDSAPKGDYLNTDINYDVSEELDILLQEFDDVIIQLAQGKLDVSLPDLRQILHSENPSLLTWINECLTMVLEELQDRMISKSILAAVSERLSANMIITDTSGMIMFVSDDLMTCLNGRGYCPSSIQGLLPEVKQSLIDLPVDGHPLKVRNTQLICNGISNKCDVQIQRLFQERFEYDLGYLFLFDEVFQFVDQDDLLLTSNNLYNRRLQDILRYIKAGKLESPDYFANKYNCTEKTIRNMINVLREQGFDIEYSRKLGRYVLKEM